MILLYADRPEDDALTPWAFRILGYLADVATAEAVCQAYDTALRDAGDAGGWHLGWIEAGPPLTVADVPALVDELRAWVEATPVTEGEPHGPERDV